MPSSGCARRLPMMLAIMVMIPPLTAMAGDLDKDYHETFAVAPGHRLVLVHGDGDVTIAPWDRDDLDVTVRYRSSITRVGAGKPPSFSVDFSQEGSTVRVVGEEHIGTTIGLLIRHDREYTYSIKAPAYLQLQLDGEDGDVSISGWRSDIDIDLDDGDITLRDIEKAELSVKVEDGDLSLRGFSGRLSVQGEDGDMSLVQVRLDDCRLAAADGDIAILDGEGDLHLETEDGRIDLRDMRLGRLVASTEDGDVDLHLIHARDLDLDLRTEDGDVEVDLPQEIIGATFDVRNDEGHIDLDLPSAKIEAEQEEHVSGRLGDGSGRIHIRTDDGTVRMREGR
jgi:DUF4097 and DUF4098 domain-containing protein YvlB